MKSVRLSNNTALIAEGAGLKSTYQFVALLTPDGKLLDGSGLDHLDASQSSWLPDVPFWQQSGWHSDSQEYVKNAFQDAIHGKHVHFLAKLCMDDPNTKREFFVKLIARDKGQNQLLLLETNQKETNAESESQRKLSIYLSEKRKLIKFVTTTANVLIRADDLDLALQRCTDLIVEHLGAAFARIWLANENVLQLKASSGLYTHIDGGHSNVPFGKFKIGLIAEERLPHLTNDVLTDPRVSDKAWAQREGMVSFAGYPLLDGERVIGVVAMFARQVLSEAVLDSLAAVAENIVLGIRSLSNRAALKASEATSRSIVESMPNGMLMVDRKGTIVSANAQAEKMFGYSRTEVIGRLIEFLLPLRYREKHPGYVRDFFKHSETRSMGAGRELFALRKGNTEFPVEIGLTPISTNDGMHVLAAVVDISQRKEAERRVSEFYSTVSHELRTPLTSIKGALRLISGGKAGELSAKARQLINVASVEAERLIRLINDILDIRKIEAGMLELRFEVCLASDLIAQTIDSLQGFSTETAVSLCYDDISNPTRIRCDRDRIIQVLTNLASNAIKFSPRGAVVEISISKAGTESVRISVKDQGAGIPDEQQHKLFEKFQQLDQSDSRPKGGTGLGLAISKAIIDQHHGKIGCDSVAGKGATFWFELPNTISEPIVVDKAEQLPYTAVLVDDDVHLSLVLTAILAEQGFRLETATTIEMAEKLLKRILPQVVILDVNLPDGSGLSLLERLRQNPNTVTIPVIMLTGSKADPVYSRVPLLIDWLVKPFSEARLSLALKQGLRLGRTGRAIALVVEDDLPTRQVILDQLESMGLRCLEAATGQAAVEIARVHHPDLIILDVGLPDIDGFQVVEILRRGMARPLGLIVYTNEDLAQYDQKKLSLGFTRHLTKSRTSESEFRETVVELLNGLLSGVDLEFSQEKTDG